MEFITLKLHVKMTILEIFKFSKHNVYLDVSLKFAMKYRTKFNVSIELVKDNEPNALLYKSEDMVSLKSITDEWFTKLTELRKLYPKNRLLKHLISTAWSSLNAGNTIKKTLEQLQEANIECGRFEGHDYKILEKVVKNNSAY